MKLIVKRLLKENPKVDCIMDAITTEELYVSEKITKALGLSEEELTGRSFFEGATTQEEKENLQQKMYELISTREPVEATARRKGKDGIVEFEAVATISEIGETPYILCTIKSWKKV